MISLFLIYAVFFLPIYFSSLVWNLTKKNQAIENASFLSEQCKQIEPKWYVFQKFFTRRCMNHDSQEWIVGLNTPVGYGSPGSVSDRYWIELYTW